MADTTTRTKLSHEQLDRLSAMLENMKADAREALANNDVIMMSAYTELLRIASRIVTKAYARIEREEQAEINRSHKELRKRQRVTTSSNGKNSEQ